MDQRIESTTVLRKLLGAHFAKIKKLDPLPRHRGSTTPLKKKLLKRYGRRCGYCSQQRKVNAAHIIPLEMGAHTEETNIILLCEQCHRLYDSGHLSINAMSKVADEWRNGVALGRPRKPLDTSHHPDPTIMPPPPGVTKTFDAVAPMQRERKYVKATKIINHRLADAGLTAAERSYLLIKRAEVTRRRSARGAVELALCYLSGINPKEVPAKYRPVFYYELNYVHRLLGNHAEAARLAQLSADASWDRLKKGVPRVDYVAASANEILCQMAALARLSEKEAKDFERRLNKLEAVARTQGEYWGGRWAMNCATHALQVRIRANDKDGSWTALSRLRRIFFDSDVSTGWDIAARQTMSQLEGLVRVLFPRTTNDLDTGIGLLARSFVSRVGYRQRPEGIRDVGFGLAMGLHKKDDSAMKGTADVLDVLMHRTVDGTSVLWPWRTI